MVAEVKLEETQRAAVVVSPKEEPVNDNRTEERVAGMANGAVEKEKAAAEDAQTKKLEEPKKGDEEKTAGMVNGAIENEKADEGMANGVVENEVAAAEDGEVRKLEEPKKGEEGENVEGENRTSAPFVTWRSTIKEIRSSTSTEMKSTSFKEESNLLSDLKEHERKALAELKEKLEEAILGNTLFSTEEQNIEEKASEETSAKEEKSQDGEGEKSEEGKTEQKEEEKSAGERRREQEEAKSAEEVKTESKEEEKPAGEENLDKEERITSAEEEMPAKKDEEKTAEEAAQEATEKCIEEGEEKEKQNPESGMKAVEVDKDISLWGVPLLPSKGEDGTNVVLLKFLRAREFRVNEAFAMLKNTLQWRKEFKTDTILEEEFDSDLSAASYLKGVDREGHPICYNIYGVFENEKLYHKTFGTGEKREEFLRWRVREMEKSIQQLDFKPGGICSFLQINDLKNSPGPSKRDLRLATKHAVSVLQDNYPEFVARNIFINVPFWYYAFSAIMSPFLTQRTRSKFVFARPSRVTETLLRYIPAEDIPTCYGGLKRENDTEFASENGGVFECAVKSGGIETVEISAPEVGTTLLWDLTVIGWDVYYKEEFVPTDEKSYTLIVKKGKKMNPYDEPIRNSFKNKEPGKLVLTIKNNTFKRKRVLYRYKEVKSSSS